MIQKADGNDDKPSQKERDSAYAELMENSVLDEVDVAKHIVRKKAVSLFSFLKVFEAFLYKSSLYYIDFLYCIYASSAFAFYFIILSPVDRIQDHMYIYILS